MKNIYKITKICIITLLFLSFSSSKSMKSILATKTFCGKVIKIWDTHTGALIKSLPDDSIGEIRFSPDGKKLAVRCVSKIKIFEAHSDRLWQCVKEIPNDGLTNSEIFHPRRPLLASVYRGDARRVVKIWDGRTGESLALVNTLMDQVILAFSPNGRKMTCLEPWKGRIISWNTSGPYHRWHRGKFAYVDPFEQPRKVLLLDTAQLVCLKKGNTDGIGIE